MNTAARLATSAQAGEIFVTAMTAEAAGLDSELPRRQLELKGKQEVVEVVTLTSGSPSPSPAGQ